MRSKRMVMFLSILENVFHQVGFIIQIPKVTLRWLWNVSVISNFKFLYMNWASVWCFLSAAIFENSKSYWSGTTTSTSHSIRLCRRESFEEFCRNFISFIWKSFEDALIKRLQYSIAMKLVTVAPRSGFPKKVEASIFLFRSCLTNYFQQYVSQHHMYKTNPVKQDKVHEITRFAHQGPVSY